MSYTVPTLSIVFMVLAALVGVAIPLVLLLVFRRKYKADRMPFWIGAAVFVLFALVLEGLLNGMILGSPFGQTLKSNIWLYGAFGGLMAGLFEETGRYTAFRTVLKKRSDNDRNALMYGAGHGGIEAFLVLSISMINNLVFSLMLNAGKSDALLAGITDEASLAAMNGTFAALAATPPEMFLLGIVERFGAVAVHLSCSVLVWFAAKDGKRFWLYPLAILLHALVNTIAVILARYVPGNLWIVEIVIYVYAAGCVALARWAWKKYGSQGLRP
jgi:uncharacterized membrane protein YhfC